MPGLTVTMTAEEADLFGKLTALVNKTNESGRAFEKASDQSKEAAKAAKEAARQQEQAARVGKRLANQLEKANESVEDSYIRMKKELKTAFDGGKISAQKYERALGQVEKGMDDIYASQLKVQAQQLKVNKANTTGFGPAAVGQIATYVSSIATIGAAWQAATAVVEQYNKEKDMAVSAMDRTVDSRRALGQVAENSTDYQNLVNSAGRISAYTGDLAEAQEFVFSGRSEGFDAEALAKYIPVVKSGSLATVAGQVNTLYGGKMSAEQTINAVLSGAKSSRLDFENLSAGLAGVAEGGRLQGTSPEEQIGSLSVLASSFKSGDTAGDRLKAFQSRLGLGGQEFGVSGLGIVAATEKIQGMSDEDRKKLLGESQEVNAAFAALSENLPVIKERIATINDAIGATGTKSSPLEKALAAQFDSSTVQGRANIAELDARKAEANLEVTTVDNTAVAAMKTKTGLALSQEALQNSGSSALGRTFASKSYQIATSLGFDGDSASLAAYQLTANPMKSVMRMGSFNQQEQGDIAGTAVQEMVAALNRQNDINNKIEQNTRKGLVTKPGDDN